MNHGNPVSFDNRPEMAGPVFVASYVPGENVEPWEPAAGNTVSAHVGAVTVLARITAAIDRKYQAEIIGFENWNEYAYKNLTPGMRIDLTYEQLFGCAR